MQQAVMHLVRGQGNAVPGQASMCAAHQRGVVVAHAHGAHFAGTHSPGERIHETLLVDKGVGPVYLVEVYRGNAQAFQAGIESIEQRGGRKSCRQGGGCGGNNRGSAISAYALTKNALRVSIAIYFGGIEKVESSIHAGFEG